MGSIGNIPLGWLLLAAWILGCDNLTDYSTRADECFEGEVVDAEFVRSGDFEAGVELKMTLDVGAFRTIEGTGAFITTTNGLFDGAPVRQMAEVTRDQISLLEFPSGRLRSYLAYAASSDGQIANVVISLMENGHVEVRIFRPDTDPDNALFGVFRLTRKEGCRPPQNAE